MPYISIDNHLPMYCQLKQIIIDNIQSGEIKDNDKLPTESELCAKFGISRSTVRQALNELEEENYIYKIHGKGSFALSGYIKQPAGKLRSFSDEITDLGHKPGAQLMDKKMGKADSETARNLNIQEGDPVFQVIRLRFIDDEIFSLNFSSFSLGIFPDLTSVDFNAASMMEEIQSKLHCEAVHATLTLEATATMPEIAEVIERKVGSPLLLMKRTTYIKRNQVESPLEFVQVYFVPDKYKYEVQLTSK